MKVYRYLTDEEVIGFNKGDTRELGSRPTAKQLENSKRYKSGVKYIHFFKNLHDLPIIQKINSSPEGKYIGMFDMPMRFMIAGNGVGEFFGLAEDEGIPPIKEYAVEVRSLRFVEFVDYVYDEHCDLTVQEVQEQFSEMGVEPGE